MFYIVKVIVVNLLRCVLLFRTTVEFRVFSFQRTFPSSCMHLPAASTFLET
jgi:hypothetical protein